MRHVRMKGLESQNKDLKQELAELKKGIQWKSKQLENKKLADMNFKANFDLNKAAAAAALAKVTHILTKLYVLRH